jgi:integrase
MPGKIITLDPSAKGADGKARNQYTKRANDKPRYRACWHSAYVRGGERIYKVERTKTLARAWITAMDVQDKYEHDHPTPHANQTMTFTQLVDAWRGTRLANLAPRTQTRYDQILRNYLTPAWGDTKLVDLTREVVKRYFNELAHHPSPTTNRPMTAGTLRKVQIVASSVFSEGMDLGYTTTNPASRPNLPAIHTPSADDEMLFLDDAEVQKLADATKDYRVAILTAAFAGLRASELWALRHQDVDLENGRIHVRRALKRTHGQGTPTDAPEFGKPKNGKARQVRLPAFLTRELRAHIQANPHPTPDAAAEALVFTAPEGGTVRHELFMARRFKPAVREALPPRLHGLRFHDLRHTAASIAIKHGATPQQVQERLGHKDARSTAIYSHLYDGHDDEFLREMDDGHAPPHPNVVAITRAKSAGTA